MPNRYQNLIKDLLFVCFECLWRCFSYIVNLLLESPIQVIIPFLKRSKLHFLSTLLVQEAHITGSIVVTKVRLQLIESIDEALDEVAVVTGQEG